MHAPILASFGLYFYYFGPCCPFFGLHYDDYHYLAHFTNPPALPLLFPQVRYMDRLGPFCVETAFFPLIMKLAGGRVHCSVLCSRPELCEPALQTLGRDSVISWNSWLQPHT